MDIDYKLIGKRIRTERLRQGLSQEQLAELAELSPVHISHIEMANTKLSLHAAVSIANALNVSLDAVICDTLEASDKAFSQIILKELQDCSPKELSIISEIIKTLKDNLRK